MKLVFVLLCLNCFSDVAGQDQWSCSAYQWKCSNDRCIWLNNRCDETDHCGDGSDEKGCDQWSCPPAYQWKCSNDRCIWLHNRCDETDHCGDGSDEKGCGRVHIVCPPYLMENQDHTCYCRSYNVSGSSTVTWQGHDSPTWYPGGLRLRNVQRADNGTQYTCVITADGVREEAVYTLRVGYGPFDDHMSVGSSYVVSNGSQPVTLTCNATNVYPTPDYTWRGVTCEKQSPPNTCTFTPDPAFDDLRNVTCRARSRAANKYQLYRHGPPHTASRTLELNVVYKVTVESVTLNGTNMTVTVKGDDQATLHLACRVYGRPVFTTVTIAKGNTTFAPSDIQYHTTGRWYFEAQITLSEVQCRDMGTYTCTANNGVDLPDTKTILLNVAYFPSKQPNETLNQTNNGVRFIMKAHPVPETFVFSHLGRTVSSAHFSSGCGQSAASQCFVNCLIVPLAIPEHQLGLYTLTVSNGIGSADIKLNIQKEDRAVIQQLTLNNTNETVTVNGDDRVTLSLTCTVSGRPLPIYVTITHGYTPLDASTIQYQRTEDRTLAVFTLEAVSCHHMGTYTCTATNEIVGPDLKKILLNVKCPPKKFFHSTVMMEKDQMLFRLAAYPVPHRFLFVHLGSQTSGPGQDVSDSFTAECEQDAVTEFIVNCDVTLRQQSRNLTGYYRAEVSNKLGKVDIMFMVPDEGVEPPPELWTAVWSAVAVVVVVVIFITVVVIWRCWHKSQRNNAGSIEDCSSGLYEEIPELPIDQQQQSSLIPAAPVEDNPVPLQRDVVVPIHADLPPLLVPVQDRLLPKIPDAAVFVHAIIPQPLSLSETPASALSPEMPDAGVWLPSIYPHRTPLKNPVPDTPLSAASFDARRHPDPNPPEEIEMSFLGETRSRAMELYAQAKETLEEDYDDFYTLLGTALLYRRQDLHLRSVLGDVEKSPDENCGEEDYYLELIPDDVPDSSHSQENCQQAVYDIPRNLALPQNDDDYLHPLSDVLPSRSQTQNSDYYLHPISDVLPSLRPQNDDDYLLPISNVLPNLLPKDDDDYLLPISNVLPNLLPKDDDDYLLPISDALSQYPRPPKGDNYLHPIYDISPKRSGSFHPKSNRSRPQRDDRLHPSSDPTKPHSIYQEDYYIFPGSDNCRPASSKTDLDKPIVFANPEQQVFGSSWRVSSICEEPEDLVFEDQTQPPPDASSNTSRVERGPPTMLRKPGDLPAGNESYLHPVHKDRTEAASGAPLFPSPGSGHSDERDEPGLLPAAHHADKPASYTLLNIPASSESITAAASDADQYHCPTGGRSPHGEVVVSSSIDNTDEPCVHDELHFTSFFDNPDDSSAENEV